MFGLKFNNKSEFHPLDSVGRGSETQLQAGEIVNYLLRVNECLSGDIHLTRHNFIGVY